MIKRCDMRKKYYKFELKNSLSVKVSENVPGSFYLRSNHENAGFATGTATDPKHFLVKPHPEAYLGGGGGVREIRKP